MRGTVDDCLADEVFCFRMMCFLSFFFNFHFLLLSCIARGKVGCIYNNYALYSFFKKLRMNHENRPSNKYYLAIYLVYWQINKNLESICFINEITDI